MTRTLLTGNAAAAWGARLAQVDYVPAFPITPQTEIIETIAAWVDSGAMPGRMVTLESEHSMITAAGAAAATGVRVFTATSSQGLLYGMEMIYTVAGWRAPFVLVNVSRGLASPITLEPDHNDIMGGAGQCAAGLPTGRGSPGPAAGDRQPRRVLPVVHP
jgi:pyruvate ferredoxin oxidoreductase alpha subunit